MNTATRYICAAGLAVLLIPCAARALEDRAEAQWKDDFSILETDFGGIKANYQDAMLEGQFPAPGQPIEIVVSSVWPVVIVRGRFTTDMAAWPQEYRSSALDLVLMYVADASHYKESFGKYLINATFEQPPEFLEEAKDPHNYKLVENLRGKPIKYTSTSSAGIGAADYTVVNIATFGLSQDGRTVMYYGDPESISDHLRDRKLVIAVLDDGNRLHFEIRAACLCKDRWLFKDEMLRRIGETMKYVGERLYSGFKVPPTKEEIDKYLEGVRTGQSK
jgi:hypothetical protein